MTTLTASPDPADLYLARLGTDHSRATVWSALTTVAKLIGADPVDWRQVTYVDLARVRAGLTAYSTDWGNTCWTVTRQVLLEARRLGVADPRMVDDVLALPRLRGRSGRLGRDLDDDELEALFDAVAPDTVRCRRDGALLALLAYGGLRRSECASVGAADWDQAASLLTVREGKGRKFRQIPIPGVGADLLDRWAEVHPGGGQLLLRVDRWGNVGGGLSASAVPKVLDRLCLTAGVAPVSAHAFRAKRITDVIAHPNGDLSLAAQLAGHSSTTVTARYDRRGIDDLRQVVDHLATRSGGGATVVGLARRPSATEAA